MACDFRPENPSPITNFYKLLWVYPGGEVGGLSSRMSAELRDRLHARRPEIKQATLARIYAIDDPAAVPDPEYAEGLQRAVSETVDFVIEAIGEGKAPPVPLSLSSQARLAARNGISFTVVARRCVAGVSVLGELVDEELEPDQAALLRRRLTRLLDDLIAEIGEAYAHEAGHGVPSRESRRAKLVEELLAGNPVDVDELAPGYDLDLWHIGLVATGTRAVEVVRHLAKASDRRLLQVCRGERSVWAWLTGRRKLESTKLQLLAAERPRADGCLAFGEPQEGSLGWRLSHHQAAAALRVGLRRDNRIVRYGEVSTEASLLYDPVRAASLRQRYLVPLEGGGEDEKLRETLHVYFDRGRNIAATAKILGVARQTVSYRLRVIEARLNVDVRSDTHELETALVLDRLGRVDPVLGP